MEKNKKLFYLLVISIFSFSVITLVLLFDFFSEKEIIIPQVKITDGGVQKEGESKKGVTYYNEKKSDIKLNKNIRQVQSAKRYMKISGKVDWSNITFFKDQYKTVIIEVNVNNNDNENRSFYMLAVDKFNKFSGYIYFREKGINKVYCYLFFDYLSNYGRKNKNFTKQTTASAGFTVNVLEEVPENLSHLIPTRNVDCGNKRLRKLVCNLTKNSSNSIEKAKTIYEYLVFASKKNQKYKYKGYKDTYPVYKGNNFYNVYTASQILKSKFGICNDFAEIYAAMMRASGYKVKKVSGFLDETKNVGHMWNIVDLTGDEKFWLRVDPSWGNINKQNYKKWAELYPEFDETFFEESFKPYNHSAFSFNRKVEY
ncbi:MAG: transglutaminase domain-containing protein [Spirochaetes bacterium]|nr:transglutaminase domain-containing protein [Spirochaetota bacterium]